MITDLRLGLLPRSLALLLVLGALCPSAGRCGAAAESDSLAQAALDAGEVVSDDLLARLQEGLEAARRSPADSTATLNARLVLLGRAHLVRGEPADAESTLVEAVRRIGAQEGKAAASIARPLFWLGTAQKDQGHYADARASLESALAIEIRERGESDPELGHVHNMLGAVLRRLGEEELALEHLQRALGLLDASPEPDELMRAALLMNLGTVYKNLSRLAESEAVQREALAIRERVNGPDHLEVGKVLHQLAEALRYQARYEEADAALLRSRAIFEAHLPENHPYLAAHHMRRGNLQRRAGDYAGARESLLRARAIHEARLGREHPSFAFSSHNLAVVLFALGDRDEAEFYYREALQIFRKVHGDEHRNVVLSLMGLGQLLVQEGRLEEAEPVLVEALALQEKVHGHDHGWTATLHTYLGEAAQRRGDHEAAVRHFLESEEIRRLALGKDHYLVGESLLFLAEARADQGRLEEARRSIDEALAILESELGEHPYVAQGLLSRAKIAWQAGDDRAALADALRAEALARAHLHACARTFPERLALQHARTRTNGLHLALAVAERSDDPQVVGAAWEALLRSRAVVQDEMARRVRSVARSEDPQLQAIGEELEEARRAHAQLLVLGPRDDQDDYAAQLRERRQRKESLEQELARRSLSHRREQERSTVGLADLQAALCEREALLAFARFERPVGGGAGYLAFVLRPDREGVTTVALGDALPLESDIMAWREQLRPGGVSRGLRRERRDPQARFEEYVGVARTLRQRLWDPLLPALAGIDRVWVVPDGATHFVSLTTLVDDDGRFLLETGPLLGSLSTERGLLRRPEESAGTSSILVVGGVDFGEPPAGETDSPCVDLSTLRFSSLSGSRREAHGVAQLWDEKGLPTLLLEGVEAREGALRERAPDFGTLHVATHGFVLSGLCQEPGEDGGRSPALLMGGLDAPIPTSRNPLQLAGLALASANRRAAVGPGEDDGLLLAEEVAALDLRGVELVVLSACDTGLGRLGSGEGILGLRRAFETAGAGGLVLSLWAVEDEAATEWMLAFHRRRLESRRDLTRAVEQASLDVLRDRRDSGRSVHPALWGAFVPVGGGR